MLVPLSRQQSIFRVMAQWRRGRHPFRRQPNIVAMDAVDHPVGTQRELVASVSNATGGSPQQFNFVELIVAVSVAQAIEALGIVRVDVKRIVGEEESAAFQQVGVDRLDEKRL